MESPRKLLILRSEPEMYLTSPHGHKTWNHSQFTVAGQQTPCTLQVIQFLTPLVCTFKCNAHIALWCNLSTAHQNWSGPNGPSSLLALDVRCSGQKGNKFRCRQTGLFVAQIAWFKRCSKSPVTGMEYCSYSDLLLKINKWQEAYIHM